MYGLTRPPICKSLYSQLFVYFMMKIYLFLKRSSDAIKILIKNTKCRAFKKFRMSTLKFKFLCTVLLAKTFTVE